MCLDTMSPAGELWQLSAPDRCFSDDFSDFYAALWLWVYMCKHAHVCKGGSLMFNSKNRDPAHISAHR